MGGGGMASERALLDQGVTALRSLRGGVPGHGTACAATRCQSPARRQQSRSCPRWDMRKPADRDRSIRHTPKCWWVGAFSHSVRTARAQHQLLR